MSLNETSPPRNQSTFLFERIGVVEPEQRSSYKGTSFIRKRTPPKTTKGPQVYAYCRLRVWAVFRKQRLFSNPTAQTTS